MTGWLMYFTALLAIIAVRGMLMAKDAEDRLQAIRDVVNGPPPAPPAEMPVARVVVRR
jgi:hypothetical protein